jgi:hypothetical protein
VIGLLQSLLAKNVLYVIDLGNGTRYYTARLEV